MQTIIAIGFLLGLASVLGVVLAVANARLRVFEDPRIDEVFDMLPNTNCGSCGLPGCRAFAEKAVAGEIQPSQCTVGGPETAAAVADFLGVDAGALDRKVARLLCAGGTNVAIQMAEYKGFPSCRAAVAAGGGGKGSEQPQDGLMDQVERDRDGDHAQDDADKRGQSILGHLADVAGAGGAVDYRDAQHQRQNHPQPGAGRQLERVQERDPGQQRCDRPDAH